MADQKISELNSLTTLAGSDLIPVVDVDQSETKNITKLNLMRSPGPIGGVNPNTGEFTTLELTTGTTVDEISTDGTLVGDSDDAVPTEQAVKTYVDAQISATDEHNELIGLQGGDSTADEFYHLDLQTYGFISSDSTSLIIAGNIHCNDLFTSGSTINVGTGQIKSTAGNVELYYGGVKAFETAADGFIFTDPVSGEVGGMRYDGVNMEIFGALQNNNVLLKAKTTGGNYTTCIHYNGTGTTALYYAGGIKMQTGGTGITVISGTGENFVIGGAGNIASIKSIEHGTALTLSVEDSGGVEETGYKQNPDGAAELYYAGTKVFETDSTGVIVTGDTITVGSGEIKSTAGNVELYYAGGKRLETLSNGVMIHDGINAGFEISYTNDDIYLQNTDPNGDIYIRLQKSAGGYNNVFVADAESNAWIYYGGSQRIQTQLSGISVFGQNATYFANINFTNEDFYLTNTAHGGDFYLRSENTGGTATVILKGDPDGDAEIYNAGIKILDVRSYGLEIYNASANLFQITPGTTAILRNVAGPAIQIKDDGNDTVAHFDRQNRFHKFYSTDGYVGFELDSGGANVDVKNDITSSTLSLVGVNSGDTDTDMAVFDPNGSVDLYYAGNKVFETDSTGIIVTGDITCDDLYTSGDTIHVGEDGGRIKSTAGNVELYDSGVKNFETTSIGINVGDGSNTTDLTHIGAIFQIVNNVTTSVMQIYLHDNTGNKEVVANLSTDAGHDWYVKESLGLKMIQTGIWIMGGSQSLYTTITQTGANFLIDNDEPAGTVTLRGRTTGDALTTLAVFDPDGSGEMYFTGNKVLATVSNGIEVTDDSGTTPTIFLDDGTYQAGRIAVLTNSDTYIRIGDTGLVDRVLHFESWGGASWEDLIIANGGGAVELYHADVKAFETSSDGFTCSIDPFYIRTSVGEMGIKIAANAEVGLYYNDLLAVASDGEGINIYDTSGTICSAKFRDSTANILGTIQNSAGTFNLLLGASSETGIVATLNGAVELYYDDTKEAETISGGFKATNSFQIASSQVVDEISDDDTLSSDSTSSLVTEQAIKAYIDSQTAMTGNESLVQDDTTATVVFLIEQEDSNYGLAYSIVNTVDSIPSIYGSVVFEKSTTGFSVLFSGSIDSNNYILSWIVN